MIEDKVVHWRHDGSQHDARCACNGHWTWIWSGSFGDKVYKGDDGVFVADELEYITCPVCRELYKERKKK